jgi:hypothetical protein
MSCTDEGTVQASSGTCMQPGPSLLQQLVLLQAAEARRQVQLGSIRSRMGL